MSETRMGYPSPDIVRSYAKSYREWKQEYLYSTNTQHRNDMLMSTASVYALEFLCDSSGFIGDRYRELARLWNTEEETPRHRELRKLLEAVLMAILNTSDGFAAVVQWLDHRLLDK